ncbi:MAG: carbohydrate-binding protein, partial [Planctomycetes bacterium]|nr:carbohydrate-binding protein [Planctomycetota bacterium]
VSVANARMTLFSGSVGSPSGFREVRANASGSYAFTNVAAGTYQLGAEALGYQYQQVAVSVGTSSVTRTFTLGAETEPGRWDLTGVETAENLGGTAYGILLPGGQPGGEILYCHDSTDPVMYDPTANSKWIPPASGETAGCFGATVFANGDVLVAGGSAAGFPQTGVRRSVKYYRRSTNAWSFLPSMNEGRWYPAVVKLADERVLVIAGEGQAEGYGRVDTCEIYDPINKTWTYTANRIELPTEMPPTLLLKNGEVLKTWRYAQRFNVGSTLWRNTGNFAQPRPWAVVGQHCDHSLIYLPDNRVMALGIYPDPSTSNPSMIEFYDAATERWTVGPTPRYLRARPRSIMLPDSRVLCWGGEYVGPSAGAPPLRDTPPYANSVTNTADIFDYTRNQWRPAANLNRFTHYHSVSQLLPDGRIIDSGGAGNNTDDLRIEAYSPPYLFRGVRPRIDAISTTSLSRGSTFTLDVSQTSAVTRVALVGARCATHWMDTGPQRYLPLAFSQASGRVTATVSSDANVVPPGIYLVYALVDDIPSVGVIVSVGTNAPITNNPPAVTLTSPLSGASFTAPATISLAATASDSNGTIAKVDFYRGSTLISSDSTAPYTYFWSNVPAGSYVLTAKATDNGGATTTSATATVTVAALTTQGPYGGIAWAIPGTIQAEDFDTGGQGVAYNDVDAANNGGAYRPEAVDIEANGLGGNDVGWIQAGEWLEYTVTVASAGSYTLDASVASAGGGGVFHVEFAAQDKTGAMAIPDTGGWGAWRTVTKTVTLTAGSQLLRIAMDQNGATGWVGNIDVIRFTAATSGNVAPTVALTSPSSGASFTAPATISLAASASDSDGTIAKVDFYNGSTLISSDSTAPYSATMSNVAAGSYSLTAVGTDNLGATTTSAAVSVTVAPGNVGLIAWWTFDEGANTIASDASGNGHSGTLVGGPTWTTGYLSGGLDFDAGDDRVSVPDFDPPTSITIEAWIRSRANNGVDSIILDKHNSEYDLRLTGNGNLCGVAGGVGLVDTSFDFYANAGQWHHVAYVVDSAAGQHRLYRDGSLVASGANSAAIGNYGTELRIGRHSQYDFGTFAGTIDDVKLWSRPLSGAEIGSSMSASASAFAASAVGSTESTGSTGATAGGCGMGAGIALLVGFLLLRPLRRHAKG